MSGWTGHLILSTIVAGIGSSFQHGYNIGVINAPQTYVNDWLGETYKKRYNAEPNGATLDIIYSVIVSVFSIGGMVGALMTPYVSERFGRRGGLFLNNVFVFIAAALMGLCRAAGSYEVLIAGRFFIGINAGLNAGIAPTYLSEIAPNELRGAIGTVYQLGVVISILLSNFLGFPQVLGGEKLWPVLFAFTAVPAILQIVGLFFCPETPKFQLIIRGEEEAAEKSLVWLRQTPAVGKEMDDMRLEKEIRENRPEVTYTQMFSDPVLSQPLTIAIIMMLSQQLSGINAAVYFSSAIFRSAKLSDSASVYATLGMSVANLIFTIVSLVLVEKVGRRTLQLLGMSGMAAMSVSLVLCLSLVDKVPQLSYLSIASVYLFVIWFSIGPGPIPWFFVGEMFDSSALGLAAGIATCANWLANFVVALAFLPLQGILGHYTFLIFTFFLVVFWLYTYRKVPETKNKSNAEVATYFKKDK